MFAFVFEHLFPIPCFQKNERSIAHQSTHAMVKHVEDKIREHHAIDSKK